MEHKLCKKCNIEKPLCEMVKKQGQYRFECKECRNKKARKRSQNDPDFREKERLRGKEKYKRDREKHLTRTRAYRNENLPFYKDLHLRNKYSITMDDKIKMREAQENKCVICEIIFESDKHAYVDHCHQTNKVRGLLCHKCNSGLGMFEDNVSSLERAISYLNKYSIDEVTIPTTPNL